MPRNSPNSMDMRRIRRLLRETTRLAERASMTGSLQGGGRIAIRQYNAIRNHLQEIGAIPEDLFQELDEDEATFDELGVVTGMLDGYLEEDGEGLSEDEERPEEEEGVRGERKWKRRGRRWEWGQWANPEVWRALGDPNALQELREVGEMIREHMPELLKMREMMHRHPPQPPVPPEPPIPPPGGPVPPTPPRPPSMEHEKLRFRAADVAARMQALADQLQREDLDYRERIELAHQLAELAREEAEPFERT